MTRILSLIYILFFLLSSQYSIGQNEINKKKLDSLHQLIKQTDSQEKINTFLELGDYYGKIDTEDLDSMRYYANKALALTKLYENTEKEIVEANSILSDAEKYAKDYKKAMVYAQKGLALSEDLDYGHGLSISNKAIGYILIDQENFTEGLYYFNKAYELAKKYNEPTNKIIDIAIERNFLYQFRVN